MALVVEDGTGRSDADSYVSLADVDAYVEKQGGNASWTALTTAQQEAKCRIATQYIDIAYAPRWKGRRTNEGQALAWPRLAVYDTDGYIIDDDVIPQRLKDATSEAVLRSIDDTLLPDVETGTIMREKVKVDVIEEDITYRHGKPHTPSYPKIDALLYPILSSGDRLYRA